MQCTVFHLLHILTALCVCVCVGPMQDALDDLGLAGADCLRDLFPLALQEWRRVLPLDTGLEIEYVLQPRRGGEEGGGGADAPTPAPDTPHHTVPAPEAAATEGASPAGKGAHGGGDGVAAAAAESVGDEGRSRESSRPAEGRKAPVSIGVDTFDFFEPFAAEQLLRATAYWLGVSEPEARCAPAERWRCGMCAVRDHCEPLRAALTDEGGTEEGDEGPARGGDADAAGEEGGGP